MVAMLLEGSIGYALKTAMNISVIMFLDWSTNISFITLFLQMILFMTNKLIYLVYIRYEFGITDKNSSTAYIVLYKWIDT